MALNASIPIHFAPLSEEHLVDCMTFWKEFETELTGLGAINAIESNVKLQVFDELFLLNHGTWWTNGSDMALAIPAQEGHRFLSAQGQFHKTVEEAFQTPGARQTQAPTVDDRSMQNLLEKLRSKTGIGLHFQRLDPSQPLDEEEIVQTLWEYSCHPFLGKRIVADLEAHGERSATVMPALARQIPSLQAHLEPLGLRVSLSSPMPSRGLPNVPQEHLDCPMPRSHQAARAAPKFR